MSQMTPTSKPDRKATPYLLACDASNVGAGFYIYKLKSSNDCEWDYKVPCFISAHPLPEERQQHTEDPSIEYASTDGERAALLLIALHHAKQYFDSIKMMKIYLYIRCDNIGLIYNLLAGQSQWLLPLLEMHEAFQFLENWGINFEFQHHHRDTIAGQAADAESRIFFPKFFSHAILFRITKCQLKHLRISDLQLNDTYRQTLSKHVVFIPLNLSNKLYSIIFKQLMIIRPRFILTPMIHFICALLRNNRYVEKYNYDQTHFHENFFTKYRPWMRFCLFVKLPGEASPAYQQVIAERISRLAMRRALDKYGETCGGVGENVRDLQVWENSTRVTLHQ